MNRPDIALIGRSRTGKDTIADYLVREHGYVRVAFADPLKEMALAVNPLIATDHPSGSEHLADVVAQLGWEGTKDLFPTARRFLQNLGVAVRQTVGLNAWIDIAVQKIVNTLRQPVVVTDVRFLNEVKALEELRFTTVSVTRPSLTALDTHVSETELATYPTDRAICNAGSIADLEADVRKYLLSA